MSYQVLARKWRPKNFREVVGQTHVLQALVNALDHDRLHHAYLFTGTRGVGKTTLARILARSLNCDTGVTSQPCGHCAACGEIDTGRFVDLIEIDAASRTKVEDTREILDNVQYAPTRGRYKVYLIDEVHMLSNHSFNALLKTLEEPPPHVKFLLATTDPQKLPATILSRCLQFNLKRLAPALIQNHLAHLLTQEGVVAESSALARIAHAADGSMRDALSLLDQAIAFGGGTVRDAEVCSMLGTVDRGRVLALAQAIAARDGRQVLAVVEEMSEYSTDYDSVLSELLSIWHRVAVHQLVPDTRLAEEGEAAQIAALAQVLLPEDTQLFYQIGILGQRDLVHATDTRAGLEMTLLRMIAFRPWTGAKEIANGTRSNAAPRVPPVTTVASPVPHSAPVEREVAPITAAVNTQSPDEWARLVARLPLEGMLRQLAMHCGWRERQGDTIRLSLAPTHASLKQKRLEERLQAILSQHYGAAVRLCIDVDGVTPVATPAQTQDRAEQERRRAAQQTIENDPVIQQMRHTFNARIIPESIRPID